MRNKKIKNNLQNEIAAEFNECQHDVCNPYVQAWSDEKFKHADQEAFQLTQDAKVYYDDDGVFSCPECNTLYTLKGDDLNLQIPQNYTLVKKPVIKDVQLCTSQT